MYYLFDRPFEPTRRAINEQVPPPFRRMLQTSNRMPQNEVRLGRQNCQVSRAQSSAFAKRSGWLMNRE
jgi:hypothetical protein